MIAFFASMYTLKPTFPSQYFRVPESLNSIRTRPPPILCIWIGTVSSTITPSSWLLQISNVSPSGKSLIVVSPMRPFGSTHPGSFHSSRSPLKRTSVMSPSSRSNSIMALATENSVYLIASNHGWSCFRQLDPWDVRHSFVRIFLCWAEKLIQPLQPQRRAFLSLMPRSSRTRRTC